MFFRATNFALQLERTYSYNTKEEENHPSHPQHYSTSCPL